MTNTKEKLIEASFHILSQSHFSTLSLSVVAQHVGVSKTAVYRHFKNKEDLVSSLKTVFFTAYTDFLKNTLSDFYTSKKHDSHTEIFTMQEIFAQSIKASITFFCQYPHYFHFLLISTMQDPQFPFQIRKEILQRNVYSVFGTALQAFDFNSFGEKKHNPYFFSFFYTMQTAVSFIFQKNTVFPNSDTTIFTEKLYTFLQNGWQSFSPVSEKRKSELDHLCRIQEGEIEPESDVFKAIARVIEEHGFPHVTIEKIAKKAGLAKSSLYSHFSSKKAMHEHFIMTRMTELLTLLNRRISCVQTFSEKTYVRYTTIIQYVSHLPSVLMIFGWMRSKMIRVTDVDSESNFNDKACFFDARFNEDIKLPNFGFDVSVCMIEGWMTMLAVSFVIYSRFIDLEPQRMLDEAHHVFSLMEKGFTFSSILEVVQ